MNNKGQSGIMIIIILFALLLAFAGFAYTLLYSITSGSETITIKEKWVKYHDQDAKYLVSSTDGQVFQITDTWIKWRFDSSNLYADLNAGDTCYITTQGWRFPFFSDYKNILSADCKDFTNKEKKQ